MIKGEYFTSNCVTTHIMIADRQQIQPYIYVPSMDILLRTKHPVMFRREDGKPEVVGCLLLYFLLRHKSMISKENIKALCDLVKIKDPRCGWRQAAGTITGAEHRIRLQRWPTGYRAQFSASYSDEQTRIIEKFGSVCKSLLKRSRKLTN